MQPRLHKLGISFRIQLLGVLTLLRFVCNAMASAALASAAGQEGLHVSLSLLIFLFIFLEDGQACLTASAHTPSLEVALVGSPIHSGLIFGK